MDAQNLLVITKDFEFVSMEPSTKDFFVLFKEYLHALNDNPQRYAVGGFVI